MTKISFLAFSLVFFIFLWKLEFSPFILITLESWWKIQILHISSFQMIYGFTSLRSVDLEIIPHLNSTCLHSTMWVRDSNIIHSPTGIKHQLKLKSSYSHLDHHMIEIDVGFLIQFEFSTQVDVESINSSWTWSRIWESFLIQFEFFNSSSVESINSSWTWSRIWEFLIQFVWVFNSSSVQSINSSWTWSRIGESFLIQFEFFNSSSVESINSSWTWSIIGESSFFNWRNDWKFTRSSFQHSREMSSPTGEMDSEIGKSVNSKLEHRVWIDRSSFKWSSSSLEMWTSFGFQIDLLNQHVFQLEFHHPTWVELQVDVQMSLLISQVDQFIKRLGEVKFELEEEWMIC